jgi:type IV pilus assembly protein PilC
MPKQAKDFVFTGKEIFDLKEKDAAAKENEVVLNIDEDDVVLTEKGRRILGKSVALGESLSWYKRINRYFLSKSKLKAEEKSNFFHLLSVMINSGIPVVKSLKSLLNQTVPESHLYMVIEDLVKRVEEGQSLSEAMSYHGEEFSEMEIGMVESGEAAGQLNKTLDNLATDIARREDIKHNIKSAMMYPVAIIGLLVVVMIVMMVFVIPKLTELFDRTASNLPLVTRIVVGTSNVMREYGLLMLVGLLLLVLIVKFAKKTEGGRYVWDNLKLGLPIFGKLFKMTYLGRFARSLANLMGSGVPIVKTLEITATSIGNEVYRKRVMLSIEDIKQGIPLAENLTDPKLFPAMLVNMVEVGEKTAQLDEIMLKLADYYENEVSVSVKGLSKIIEPLLLIIIGLSVGLVVAAIMMPIMQLSNLAGSL